MTEPMPESSPNPRPRILLIEDHPAVRHGLQIILDAAGLDVCGEAETVAEGLRAAADLRPDLAIVDLSLGEESGLGLLQQLSHLQPELPLMVYSMYEDAAHVMKALAAGATAYVAKREPARVVAEAARACLSGERTLSPRIEAKLAETATEPQPAEAFSAQEQQIFALMGQGLATAFIAARMDLSPRTVQSYYNRMLVKLNLPGMKDLRARAVASRV